MSASTIMLTLVAIAPPAGAQADAPMASTAKVHLDRGLAFYADGRYEQAIEELRLGQTIDPKPEFLYALGQCERKLGHCDRAIDYYRAFLTTAPPAPQSAAVRAQIDRCQQELAISVTQNAATAPPARVGLEQHPSVPLAPPPEDHPRHFYDDWLGNTLCGIGVIALGTGTVLAIDARGELDMKPQTYDQYASARDAQREQTIGAGFLIGGGILVATGLVRYWMKGHR